MSKRAQFSILLIFIVLLSGCSSLEAAFAPLPTIPPTVALPTDPPQTATPWPTFTETVEPTATLAPTARSTRTPHPSMTPSATLIPIIRARPENFPVDSNPLTGLPAHDLEKLERKPVIVKISNYPHGVRPQWGLSLADHVFEYYLEDGLTRFAGVFYGNDASKVGPIRSGRIFDSELLKMYNGIVVYNSADKKVLDYFQTRGLNNSLVLERPGISPLWREPRLPEPHNLFGNTAEISAHVTERGTNNERPDLVTNAFYSLGNYGQDWAMQVHINYSYANYAYWEYDLGINRYLRYQGSADNLDDNPQYELLTDSLTETPIAADNVIVLFVDHAFFYHSSDTEIFEIDLNGTGDAFIFRDGKANPVQWNRLEEDKPLTITDLEGAYFPLKAGITFFQIVHTDSSMTRDQSVWEFNFIRPEDDTDE